MSNLQRSLHKNRLAFAASVVVVVLVVTSLVGYNLWRLRAVEIESHLKSAAQHAGAFEEHLSQAMGVIDLSLVSLAEQNAPDAAVQSLLRNARYLRSVSVVGADGRITESSEPRNVGLQFDDTGFLPAAIQAAPTLRVGPLVGGRDLFNAQAIAKEAAAPTQSFITVQREVLSPTGSSVRLVAVVNPDYFLNYYGRDMDAAAAEVRLLRADGSLLLSTAQNYFPGSFADTPVMALLVKAEAGHFQQQGTGEQHRLTGYRASRFFPLVVVVHLDTGDVLRVWRQEATYTVLATGVLLGMALAIALFFFGRFQRLAADRGERINALNTQKYALDQHAIVSRTDAQGTITYANDRFCLISGYSREELIGQNHRLIKSAEHSVSFFSNLWDTITRGEVWHGEVCNLRKTGEIYWVSATVVPLLGPDGFVQEYIAIRTDITDRKRIESSLEVAKNAAEQASVAKSQFLANMSHEIRTPMNAILGMLQLLQRTALTEEQKDYTEKTAGAARSLLGLLNDILDFSKVEAGKMELDVRPFVLSELMRDVEVILASNVGSKPVRLVLEVAPDVAPHLLGDDMRLRQVLVNLGGNALKFTEQGEVRVRVRMAAQPDMQDRVEFSVRDSGIGIAPEHLAHIFDGFSQAESSTTRRFGGTGLGLAICQRLVGMMGGELQLSSVLGEGSCFYFAVRLPATDSPVVNTPEPVTKAAAAAPPADKVQRLQGMHLLVVEDNKINQMVATGLLSQEGATITLAENGALGVQAVANAQRSFDAVLMDLQMPVMDGFEATRSIRQDLGIVHLPIIAMTANAMASDREACLAVGMNDHVGKPFELDHLVGVLQRLVRPVAQAAVAPVHAAPVLPQQYPSGDLDVEGALARVGGDHEIYASVLQAFALEMEQVPQQLQAQWASAAPEQAARTMHTLKGLAATVGARHLSMVAAQLEQEIKKGVLPAQHPRIVAQLREAMDALFNTLLPVLQGYQEAQAGPVAANQTPLNPAQLRQDLQALAGLLENSNMLALDAHTKIQKLYAAHLGSELHALRDAMGGFDFATAHRLCVQLLDQHAA